MLIKTIISIALSLCVGLSFAGDNKVYVDQIGDNSNITVTQDGAGNTMKGLGVASDQKSLIKGDNTNVTVTQQGSGNSLILGLNAGNTGSTNTLLYQLIGSNANATINCNNAGQGDCDINNISIKQSGDGAVTDLVMNATGSLIDITQAGGNNQMFNSTIVGTSTNSTVSMTGGSANEMTLIVGATTIATNATSSITTVGALNKVTLTQDGGGPLGHNTTIAVTGSSNTYNVTQSGTSGDSIVNLKTTGSGNTFVVNSNTH
jgi:hypothetical protein